MSYKKLKLIVVLLLGLGLSGIQAQNVVPATGGNASGIGGSASYSVGQVVYITNTGTNGSVAQGVQQPYEISVVTAIEEASCIKLDCSAYPNPTTDLIILKVENYKTEYLSYQLYDINARLLENKKIQKNETIIAMNNLVSAIYFLKVTDSNKEIKTFKIIKN